MTSSNMGVNRQYKASLLRAGVSDVPTNSAGVKTAKDNSISISDIIKIIKPRNKKLGEKKEENYCKDYIKTIFFLLPLLLPKVHLT